MTGDEYQHRQLLSMGVETKSEEWPEAAMLGMQASVGALADLIVTHRWNETAIDPTLLQRYVGAVLWHTALLCNATGLRLSIAMAVNIARVRELRPVGAVSVSEGTVAVLDWYAQQLTGTRSEKKDRDEQHELIEIPPIERQFTPTVLQRIWNAIWNGDDSGRKIDR